MNIQKCHFKGLQVKYYNILKLLNKSFPSFLLKYFFHHDADFNYFFRYCSAP